MTKGLLDRAVSAMQVYLGSVDRAPLKQAVKHAAKMSKLVEQVADEANISVDDALKQIEREARRRGVRWAKAKTREGGSTLDKMQKGRRDSLLAKPVTFGGRRMTKAEMIEALVREGGALKRDRFSKYQFSRTAFNRMDHAQQREYDAKMKIKMLFAVELPSGSFYEITKTEADYFLEIGGHEG